MEPNGFKPSDWSDRETILDVHGLTTTFWVGRGQEVTAVDGISFAIHQGEAVGVVGESGSGKSVTMLSILGLIPKNAGRVKSGSAKFMGRELVGLPRSELRKIRGNDIAMIFQDPMTSLNPVFTIGNQISEPLMVHKGMSSKQAKMKTVELLEAVGIPSAKSRFGDHPHEFSGGMRQRVMIAMALSCDPKLLIADEPTTALDVTVQAQILELLNRLRHELGMALILVTHDLGVVAGLADRINVMYAGEIVETGSVDEVFADPRHPYTIGLLESVPRVDDEEGRDLRTIPGRPPNLTNMPTGCRFRPRCRFADIQDELEKPVLSPVEGAPFHLVACFIDVQTGKKRVPVAISGRGDR